MERSSDAGAAPSRPSSPAPSLWPREHGALGQLALPLATGLALGRPGAAAVAVALLRVRPQRFTQVGWSLVGASVVALAVLVAGYRGG